MSFTNTAKKNQIMILTYNANKSYLTVFIKFCTKIFDKFHEFFQYESKFDLAIKNVKVNPRSSLEHFGQKILKIFHEILLVLPNATY